MSVKSSLVRACNQITPALVPRDIFWRLSVIAVYGLVVIGVIQPLSAQTAFVLATVTLAICLIVQGALHPVIRYIGAFQNSGRVDKSHWWKMARSFWLASVVAGATPMLTVVAVGLVERPEVTGPFFAALKTAQLMTLLLLAANLAATPLVSRHCGVGDTDTVRQICQLVSAVASGFALLGLVVFFIFGEQVLGLFGASFVAAQPELMVLSIGFACSAIGGPNAILMQIADQEPSFARLSLGWNGLGVAAMIPGVMAFGTIGAAVAFAGATIGWNVHAWVLCRRRIGIDPSVFGFILPAPIVDCASKS